MLLTLITSNNIQLNGRLSYLANLAFCSAFILWKLWTMDVKYVVRHKSAKLFMTYAVGKLEGALIISYLISSTSSQRVS